MNGELALFTDASNHSIGAVLQQRGINCWKPIAFLSKKLSKAETKYSAFNREMLDIYRAMKHFRQILEARTFIIYTNNKPLTFAFKQKRNKSSQRHVHIWISFQFITDIRHI